MTPRFTLLKAFFSLLRDLFDLLFSPYLLFYDTYICLHLYPLRRSRTQDTSCRFAILSFFFFFAISHHHLHVYVGELRFTMWL